MDWTDNDLSRSRFQAGEMMKLDYSDLISPFSFYVERIGHVKTPTLRAVSYTHLTLPTNSLV